MDKTERVREVQERRRSGASGLHIKTRKNRLNTKRRAIDQNRRDSGHLN
jgi:hypothetical protein